MSAAEEILNILLYLQTIVLSNSVYIYSIMPNYKNFNQKNCGIIFCFVLL